MALWAKFQRENLNQSISKPLHKGVTQKRGSSTQTTRQAETHASNSGLELNRTENLHRSLFSPNPLFEHRTYSEPTNHVIAGRTPSRPITSPCARTTYQPKLFVKLRGLNITDELKSSFSSHLRTGIRAKEETYRCDYPHRYRADPPIYATRFLLRINARLISPA